MRPVDVRGFNLRRGNARHRAAQGGDRSPVDAGLVHDSSRHLCLADLRDVRSQGGDVGPGDVSGKDVCGRELGDCDLCNVGIELVGRDAASDELPDTRSHRLNGVCFQDRDKGYINLRPRNGCILDVRGLNGGHANLG